MNGYAGTGFTFYNLDYGLYGGVFVGMNDEFVFAIDTPFDRDYWFLLSRWIFR